MKSLLRPVIRLALGAFAAMSASTAFGSDWLNFFFPSDLETIVVTDVTEAGRAAKQPTPEHPIYYAAISAGYRDFGGLVAGEKPMPRELMNKTVMKVLAKQGYLPAGKNQRPDIYITWTWGTLNAYRVYVPLGRAANGDYGHGINMQVNEPQMRWFLGGAKLGVTWAPVDPIYHLSGVTTRSSLNLENSFPEYSLAPGLKVFSGPAQQLIDTAKQDLYVAVVGAYDVDLDLKHHAKMLWNTRISAPARGFWLPEALPPMLAIAGPYLGHETAKPQWILASEHFKPDIRIGDPRVVEYIEKSGGAVANFGPSN